MRHQVLSNEGCKKFPSDFSVSKTGLLLRGSAHQAEWPLLGLGSTKLGQIMMRGKDVYEVNKFQSKKLL